MQKQKLKEYVYMWTTTLKIGVGFLSYFLKKYDN